MATKRVLNSEELEELGKTESVEYEGTRLAKKFKNSLDSDEEDDEKKADKYNVMNPEEFDGQEEATIEQDGEIKITPFNMKEEMEEGHFDKDGTYIFAKNENEIKDQWLDDIDWVKVKSTENTSWKNQKDESDSDDLPELDVIGHYKTMLDFMKEGETVQKAICRLGNASGPRGARHHRKNVEISEEEKEAQQKNREKLQELTSLASELLQNGDTDIYQQTFEKLTFLIKSKDSKHGLYDTSDAADMFGDSFDEKPSSKAEDASKETGNGSNEVMWEFKWESKEESTVYGPHSTEEMLNWVQEGYFNDGVYVRKASETDAGFYSSKRIDFELYL